MKSLFRASGVLLSALVMLTLVRIKVQISVRIQISLGDSQYHSKATYCQKLKKKKKVKIQAIQASSVLQLLSINCAILLQQLAPSLLPLFAHHSSSNKLGSRNIFILLTKSI